MAPVETAISSAALGKTRHSLLEPGFALRSEHGVSLFSLPTIRDPHRKKIKSARLLDAIISFRHLYPQFSIKTHSLQRAAGMEPVLLGYSIKEKS